ncbi:hypothetical protein RFI_04724 [Reticulomyxa filosa]|uniref:Uncharacterized protein n=1 Tax=Reticulomyxa filosa TaxID=46433 RepID=X6P485_RETFI|nr:hypothetical protein RFI_04724 [Reticulomyxa filosa]|eukprot:ETO32392.1 hypothetical protein RFI_04724 [Reticulomyxa filosa]
MLDTFRLSSQLLKTFDGHTSSVWSIDYSIFNSGQFICSGSGDNTVRIWDTNTSKLIQLFNGHLGDIYCVKFSPYHYHNHNRNVICSSSQDTTIRFWDIKDNRQLKILNGHAGDVCGIEFSSFNGGRYLCSGSWDRTMRLWDVEISKSLHAFNGHTGIVWCLDISPLQSKNDSTKSNNIGVIGGNGYTICSGSEDATIRIWDIETTKQLILFKGHESPITSVKYRSNELGMTGDANTILSGSLDKSVRLWDNRSDQQIQIFNGHTCPVMSVEYSPFVVNNIEFSGSSSVICSGSDDNTIRFWDIRLNKKELHIIKGDDKDRGIICIKFLPLRKQENKSKDYRSCGINLCYGSREESFLQQQKTKFRLLIFFLQKNGTTTTLYSQVLLDVVHDVIIFISLIKSNFIYHNFFILQNYLETAPFTEIDIYRTLCCPESELVSICDVIVHSGRPKWFDLFGPIQQHHSGETIVVIWQKKTNFVMFTYITSIKIVVLPL